MGNYNPTEKVYLNPYLDATTQESHPLSDVSLKPHTITNTNQESVSEKDIQDFWSDFPMIYDLKMDQSSPEEIYQFMEDKLRNECFWYQEKDKPLLSNYMDYSSLKNKRVLEIGFGAGWWLNEFMNAGAEVHGIDLSRAHYKLSKHRFRNEDITLQLASAEKIPYPDNYFDFVGAYGVLHHAQNDKKCYEELHRVLKPGGKSFLMLYRKGGAKYYFQKIIKKGIMRGGLFKNGLNLKKFINSVTDSYTDDSPGAPVSRHYTKLDLKKLFTHFSNMKTVITGTPAELSGIPAGRLPVSDWLLNDQMRANLLQMLGGFWFVYLTK